MSILFYIYLNTDRLGSGSAVTDGRGEAVHILGYMPYGETLLDLSHTHYETPYQFTGYEKDQETGLHYAGARYYDSWLSTFNSTDPMWYKYPHLSPYAYCGNNPLRYVDPTGLAPIYAPDGTFLGTDDEGLRGAQLILDRTDFTQGMAHADAQKVLWVGEMTQEARNKMDEHVAGLSSRPDYDGKLTFFEANDWYRNGNGQPLFVDASKIDLSPVTTKELKEGEGKYINFASPSYANTETGLVYGNIKLTLLDGCTGEVKLGRADGLLDNYSFEMHKRGSTFRNIATKVGKALAGSGTAYDIFNYNNGKVKVKK